MSSFRILFLNFFIKQKKAKNFLLFHLSAFSVIPFGLDWCIPFKFNYKIIWKCWNKRNERTSWRNIHKFILFMRSFFFMAIWRRKKMLLLCNMLHFAYVVMNGCKRNLFVENNKKCLKEVIARWIWEIIFINYLNCTMIL